MIILTMTGTVNNENIDVIEYHSDAEPYYDPSSDNEREPGKGQTFSANAISKLNKFSLFCTTFFFWGLSLSLVGVGIYVYQERTVPILQVIEFSLDPSAVLMLCGFTSFLLTTCGFVGTLRENICLLKTYAFGLLALVILLIALLIMTFLVLYTGINISINPHNYLQKALVTYVDENHMRDLMDYIQMTLQCCGIGSGGYIEWTLNPYYNCSDSNPSIQRCGVPFSCCKINTGEPINMLCGMDTINHTLFDVQNRIYTEGCTVAVARILQENAFIIGASIFGVTLLLFCGAFLAARHATEIHRHREQYILFLQRTNPEHL